jgi:integration host factor subunit beta
MTKTELVDAVARRQNIPRGIAERVVNVLFDGIRDALVRGDRVEIRGFGTFQARHYQGYTGRNPRTGQPIVVSPKVLPVFRVGKELRIRMNGGLDPEG